MLKIGSDMNDLVKRYCWLSFFVKAVEIYSAENSIFLRKAGAGASEMQVGYGI
ncbi:MAG: Uncharacterised protein [Hyphomonas sp. TMED17]|nr:MAG: Uncharacterised protein [Hyphomonas sp. TMED17]